MSKANKLLFQCPYCDQSYAGNVGAFNLDKHVQKEHEDYYDAFKKLPKTQIKIDEPDEPEEEEQPIQYQTLPTASSKISLHLSPPEPATWIETFLKRFDGMKQSFIDLMKMRVHHTKELPHPTDFERELITFDSGFKSKKPEASYIRMFYETELNEYLREKNMPAPMRGFNMTSQEQEQQSYMPGRGIPLPQNPYSTDPYQSQYRPQPSYYQDDRIARLETELRRRDDDARRRQEYEMQQLRMQLEQAGQRNPEMERLEMKLEQQEKEHQHLLEELSRQKEERLAEKISRLESMARSGPSAEQIKSYIDQAIQSEHDRITARDLDDKIKQAFNANQGITQPDVDLKKAEHEFVIESKKLDAEREKATQWGSTLKDVAGIFGESIGSALSNRQPKQEQQQLPKTAPQTPCPACGLLLELPPNVEHGICPGCNEKLDIMPNGTAILHKQEIPEKPPLETPPPNPFNPLADKKPKETPPPPPPPEPKEMPKPKKKPKPKPEQEPYPDDYIGDCRNCGKKVYETGPAMNIGGVEKGKPICKDCHDSRNT